MLNDFFLKATFLCTVVLPYRFLLLIYTCLLIYTRLTICAENLLLLHLRIARLSTETAAFFFFSASSSPACLFLDAFRRSLQVAVVFTVVSLSIIHCRPSWLFICSLPFLPRSPCRSVVYFAFLSPLSAS